MTPQMRESLRHALAIERPAPGGRCAMCKPSVLMDGKHARVCCTSGGNTARHHAVRDALHTALRADAHVAGVLKESRTAFVSGANDALRVDVIIPAAMVRLPPTAHQPSAAPTAAGCVDVTIVAGTSNTHVSSAAQGPTALFAQKSLQKFEHYRSALDLSQSTLYTAAFEQHGATSPDVCNLVRVLSQHQADASDGALRRSQCMLRWRQVLSVALQRGISRSAHAVWQLTVPDGGRAPDLGNYARIRLLRPDVAAARAPCERQWPPPGGEFPPLGGAAPAAPRPSADGAGSRVADRTHPPRLGAGGGPAASSAL